MFKFLKKHKLSTLLISLISFLFVGTIVASIAWYSLYLNIETPDVHSGIMSSYFDKRNDEDIALVDGDPAPYGSEGNPYVITRPVHFYNLARLQELNYESFSSGNLYFEFGKKNIDGDLKTTADNDVYQFYKYEDGEAVAGQYSAVLDMSYYTSSSSNEIVPIGSCSYPFVSHIVGHDLTVKNLHIAAKGRSDIGVFGYVGQNASVQHLYFDNTTIDLADITTTEAVNHSGHTGHIETANIGYIAGHIKSHSSFEHVYTNNCQFTTTKNITSHTRNIFGYFGYCDDAEIPQTGNDESKFSLNPAAVYNYFDANYSTIQGNALATRNTEYTPTGEQHFSTASSNVAEVVDDPQHYTFNNADSKAYSLATAGYQKQEKQYIAEYKNGNSYTSLTGANENTQNIPREEQTNTGGYLFYDTVTDQSNPHWAYYVVGRDESSTPQPVTYNVYTISYKDYRYYHTSPTTTTYYLKYNDGSLGYETAATFNAAVDKSDYYFAFLLNSGDTGLSTIENASGNSYYIYSPSNDKFLFSPTINLNGTDDAGRSTLKFCSYSELESGTSGVDTIKQNRFAISGAQNTSISFNYEGNRCSIIACTNGTQNNPKAGRSNGSRPVLFFDIHGASNGTKEKNGDAFVKVDDPTTLTTTSSTPAGSRPIITFAARSSSTPKAISSIHNKNNQGSVTNIGDASVTISSTVVNDVTKYYFFPNNDIGRYRLDYYNTDQYSFYDIDNAIYISNENTTSNGLGVSETNGAAKTAWTFSNGTNVVHNAGSASKYIAYNRSNNIFSGYTSGQGEIDVYQLQSNFPLDIHYEVADTITVNVSHNGAIRVSEYYEIWHYYQQYGISSRTLLTEPNVSWDLVSNPSTVTLSPSAVQSGWHKVQNTSDLIVGEKYVITGNPSVVNAVAGSYDFSNSALGVLTTSTFSANYESITSLAAGALEFVLGGNGLIGYTLSCSSGMLYGESGGGINFTGDNSASSSWSITINSDADSTILLKAGSNLNSLQYDDGLIKTYDGTKTPLCMYRYDDNSAQYIGDKIGAGYYKDYLDVVGSANIYSDMITVASSSVDILSSGSHLNDVFYNTEHIDNAVVIRVPNRGSLDFGKITITCDSEVPVFLNNDGYVTLDNVGISTTGATTGSTFTLYLNKYNIKKLSYCVLGDREITEGGNSVTKRVITGCYNKSGSEVFDDDGTVAEYVLVLGASSSTAVHIKNVDYTLPELRGNIGDFGTVGFRSAPSQVPGEIVSFTYELIDNTFTAVSNSVEYDSDHDTYLITFTATGGSVKLYVYNYDANYAKVKVNGVTKTGSFITVTINP